MLWESGVGCFGVHVRGLVFLEVRFECVYWSLGIGVQGLGFVFFGLGFWVLGSWLRVEFFGQVGFEGQRPDVVVPCWRIWLRCGVRARVLEFGVGVSISESGLGADRGGVRTLSSPAGAGYWSLVFGGLCF